LAGQKHPLIAGHSFVRRNTSVNLKIFSKDFPPKTNLFLVRYSELN